MTKKILSLTLTPKGWGWQDSDATWFVCDRWLRRRFVYPESKDIAALWLEWSASCPSHRQGVSIRIKPVDKMALVINGRICVVYPEAVSWLHAVSMDTGTYYLSMYYRER